MNQYVFSEVKIGLEESFSVTVDSSKLDYFLDISGDINPLHTDDSYARSKGFDNRVVYGMLTASFYSTLVGVFLPGKFCILQGIEIQFNKPVYIGDHLTISGMVTYINDAYKQLEIKASIINQDDKKVSKALIKVGLIDE